MSFKSSIIYSLLLLISMWGCGYKKIYSSEEFALLEKEAYLSQLTNENNPIIIDVRTPLEYSRGHVQGAQNISFIGFSFEERAAKLDTNRPVYIYCETAHRSPYAMRTLKKLGFSKIYDLKKGYSQIRDMEKESVVVLKNVEGN